MFKCLLKWRVLWSNIRNKNNIIDYHVDEKIIDFRYDVLKIARILYKNFQYTYDNATELFDSMRYPAQCYLDYKQGKLKDDCDGFHAAMYYILENNNFDCCLLTYVPKKVTDSHTVLLIKYINRIFKLDYRTLTSYNSVDNLISELEKKHGTLISYNLVKFNKTKKWYIINKF